MCCESGATFFKLLRKIFGTFLFARKGCAFSQLFLENILGRSSYNDNDRTIDIVVVISITISGIT